MLSAAVIKNITPHLSIPNNNQRRLSIISKQFDNEYNQQHVHVIGSELSQALPDSDGNTHIHRLTQLITIDEDKEENVVEPKGRYLFLFIIEPILTGCILFPLLVLFWDCGWNLFTVMLNSLNDYALTYNLDGLNYTEFGYGNYSPQSLIVSYVIEEILLLILYLGQDVFYNFLKRQHSIIEMILIKIHSLLLASLYIVQWEMIWTIMDQYTPSDWTFMMVLSLASIFLLIVITGTLADFVCSPLVVSYDSIECCIEFECPLMTTEHLNRWKINLMNFILYEIIIANINIIAWHGFYTILDDYLYPDDTGQSIWMCLVLGYPLYFPLMYFQYYFEKLDSKYKYWTVFSSNFPQFHRNIFHALAFACCIFLWRAYWVLYDNYLRIFDQYYDTYLLIALLVFGFLSVLQTFSSMNGPLKTMEDNYRFFPIYPNCYVSTVVYKLSQLSYLQSEKTNRNKKVFPTQNLENNNKLNNIVNDTNSRV